MTAPADVYGISILNGLLNRLLNRDATVGLPLGAKLISGLVVDFVDAGDEAVEFLDFEDSMSVSSLTRGVSSMDGEVLLATCLSKRL